MKQNLETRKYRLKEEWRTGKRLRDYSTKRRKCRICNTKGSQDKSRVPIRRLRGTYFLPSFYYSGKFFPFLTKTFRLLIVLVSNFILKRFITFSFPHSMDLHRVLCWPLDPWFPTRMVVDNISVSILE